MLLDFVAHCLMKSKMGKCHLKGTYLFYLFSFSLFWGGGR